VELRAISCARARWIAGLCSPSTAKRVTQIRRLGHVSAAQSDLGNSRGGIAPGQGPEPCCGGLGGLRPSLVRRPGLASARGPAHLARCSGPRWRSVSRAIGQGGPHSRSSLAREAGYSDLLRRSLHDITWTRRGATRLNYVPGGQGAPLGAPAQRAAWPPALRRPMASAAAPSHPVPILNPSLPSQLLPL